MKARGNRRHFTIEQWADYARNLGPKDQLKVMEGHLEQCRKCAKQADMWHRLSRIAQRPQTTEPPEAVTRTVKSLYSIHGPKKAPLRSVGAELLFDSLRNPLQAGTRSAALTSRQLLFGSGDYRVDLRIQPQQDSDKVSIVGQVLHATDRDMKLDSAPVALVQDGKLMARSKTNHLGEFQLEFVLEAQLELRITLPDRSEVFIPLVEPIHKRTRGNFYSVRLADLRSDARDENGSTRKKR